MLNSYFQFHICWNISGLIEFRLAYSHNICFSDPLSASYSGSSPNNSPLRNEQRYHGVLSHYERE